MTGVGGEEGGQTMKSAYELAMERLGGTETAGLTQAQKLKLADVHSLYEARIAQAKLQAEADFRKAAGDEATQDKIRAESSAEIARLNDERDGKKDALRREFAAKRR
jgi:hypothetical protein